MNGIKIRMTLALIAVLPAIFTATATLWIGVNTYEHIIDRQVKACERVNIARHEINHIGRILKKLMSVENPQHLAESKEGIDLKEWGLLAEEVQPIHIPNCKLVVDYES